MGIDMVDQRTLLSLDWARRLPTCDARLQYACGCVVLPDKRQVRLCQYHTGYDDALDTVSAAT